ncbi:hypothetical protein FS842_006888 [Serendipita sp. 407]|nr:hypothetical protein FS842_006888 [Serendipita sp. 407]
MENVEDDSGAQQEFPTQIHLLYAMSRALRKGDAVTGRKSLPIELIIEIFRLAEFVRPSLLKHSNQSFSISDGGREILHIDANTLFPRRMRLYLQLETTSHDQGWCSDPNSGNWTWFQINILQPDPNNPGTYIDKPDPNDTRTHLHWFSHHNDLAEHEFKHNSGPVFGLDHPLWTHLGPEDRISVRAEARFPGWCNYVRDATLVVRELFDPARLG